MVVFDLKSFKKNYGVKVVTKNGNDIYCLKDFTGDVSFFGGDDFYIGVVFGANSEPENAVFGIKWGDHLYENFRRLTNSKKTNEQIDEDGDLFESKWAFKLSENFEKEVMIALRVGGM